MFRIAMLSRWHPHGLDDRYVKELAEIPEAKITCVWDEVPERGAQWASELGVDFEADLDRLLARKDVDGVCVTAPTVIHRELIVRAAEAGKHVFTEKTLATTKAEALEVKKAVEKAGIQFCISFPRRSNPEFAYAHMLYEAGELGEIAMMRVHNGVGSENLGSLPDYWLKRRQTGGGAMMDLGCHPIYLEDWFLGKPKTISSCFTHLLGREVEDAAVCSMTFANHAIAMAESTFDAPAATVYTFEVYGTKATYLSTIGCKEITLKRFGKETEYIPAAKLPQADPSPMNQWISACLGKGKVLCGIDDAVLLSQILEAAYRAAAEGRTVEV